MAKKITELTKLSTAPSGTDVVEIVDVSDTSMAATGTNKGIEIDDFFSDLILNAENQYYVSAGGDNTANGLTQSTAVQDFSTALGLASAGDFIYCEDASSFDEDIDGVSGVSIYSPKATLSMTSSNNLVLEDGRYIFDTIEGDNDNSLVLNSASSDYAILIANRVNLLSGGSGVAIRNSVGSLLDVKVKQFAIIGDGDGIGDFTGVTAHTHIEIDDFYLHSTGDAISVTNGGEVVGSVQHCSYVSSGSGNFVNVTDGTVDLNCHLIESDINIGASGTANLKINKMTGDITVAAGGTLYINCPEFTGTLTNSGTVFGQLGDKFYGVNNFQSFPITPSSAPTTDYQVANRKFVLDNTIGSTVTTDATLTGTGVSGDALGIDLTNSNTWTAAQKMQFDRLEMFDDFISGESTPEGSGIFHWDNEGNQVLGWDTTSVIDSSHPGVTYLTVTSSASSHNASMTARKSLLTLGAGETIYRGVFRWNETSGTDAYLFRIGLMEGSGLPSVNNGVYFENDGTTIYATSTAGGTSTQENTTVTHARDTWYTFEIKINELASEVEFYINGSITNTITRDIPTAGLGVSASLEKTADDSPTAIYMYCDLMGLQWYPRTSRF